VTEAYRGTGNKRSKTTAMVGARLTFEEIEQIDQIAADTHVNRSTVLREAFLWAAQDQEFLNILDSIEMKNGRTR